MMAATAIADPVRREILELLRADALTVGDIARHFAISRPAISKHLRVLRDSGVVRAERRGRNQVHVLEPAPLAELAEWLTHVATPPAWQRRLDALDTEVRRAGRDRRRTGGATTKETA